VISSLRVSTRLRSLWRYFQVMLLLSIVITKLVCASAPTIGVSLGGTSQRSESVETFSLRTRHEPS
jgi:hypothetical protein